MLKSQKSQLICSNCSRIFKDPIELPCKDSICRQHLKERDIVKQNSRSKVEMVLSYGSEFF
jgi:hypothetical protein